jgi:CDP-2,3-bis-(O-geranylgeranyl)-sn-glycerol synthase
MPMMDEIIKLFIFILPAYIANATPVLLGGGAKMDFGRNFKDGKRLLGDGKTWRGFFSGVLAGTLAGFFLNSTKLGFLLAFGALVGDTLGSFIKRRIGIAGGKPSFALDQLMFLFVALAFAYPLLPPFVDIYGAAFLTVLTYVMHVLANLFAHKMGWKKVPW